VPRPSHKRFRHVKLSRRISVATLALALSSPGLALPAVLEPAALYMQESQTQVGTNEKMYRCDHVTPLFTNKTSYGCEEYVPRGAITAAPNELMFPQRVAESGPVSTVSRPILSDVKPSHVCDLYEEWIALNEQTTGGFLYQSTDQTRRWYTLARIFSGIGVPFQHCP
jgi:hypothetical protein